MRRRRLNESSGDLPIDPDVDVRDERAHPERDAFRPPASRFPRGRRRTWDILAMIAAGGGLGSLARYLAGQAIPVQPGAFPWASFLVNAIGCFALGALMVFVLDVWPPSRYARPFLGVGFIGGFTTFSTFTAEIVDLVSRAAWTPVAMYTSASLIVGLAAVWAGIVLARTIAGLPVRQGKEPAAETAS
ncbi:fluoride efflux transporter CrcB [Sphaerimonospora cavernae]|uniref:Fluoride-specific ion channel FluC n=1 Tax=Sphaerimonospora cavernae TaxID=1740611 RepID=A0ABV6U6B8_9ACTN